MNNQPNRGPMPWIYMLPTALAALTLFVSAALMWDDHHALAVTNAILGVALLVGVYLVKSRAWRDGMLPIRRH